MKTVNTRVRGRHRALGIVGVALYIIVITEKIEWHKNIEQTGN